MQLTELLDFLTSGFLHSGYRLPYDNLSGFIGNADNVDSRLEADRRLTIYKSYFCDQLAVNAVHIRLFLACGMDADLSVVHANEWASGFIGRADTC